MKRFLLAIGIIFLWDFNAPAQIPSDSDLRIQINNLSKTNLSGIISNTMGDVQYEIQCRQGRTNWVSVGVAYGSELTNWTRFDFRTTDLVDTNRIRIRSWEEDGSGLPYWWQLRYFGDAGIDPYGNPAGDGWSNVQKFQNNMDPFKWYQPAKPDGNLSFQQAMDFKHENSVLTWRCDYGPIPDLFIIERANRTVRRMTNNFPPGHYTNGRIPTNYPPRPFPSMNHRPGWQQGDPFVTGPYEVIAQVSGQPNVRDYRYVDTNVDTFPGPVYSIRAHYAVPPLYSKVKKVTTETIRKTILTVTAKQETNGYALTIWRPALHVRYLLLVQDKNDPQWRASGYFVSGTNGDDISLQVDKKGMMSGEQSPISMPPVKFLPDVVQPEFAAGYGEDSDGDYLPDIYEVLVAHTDPANEDTGDTGTSDGLKKMTGDGLSNFEKFRCRVDPLRPARPPATKELLHPTGKEIWEALMPATDLHCRLQIEVRTNVAAGYQPVDQVPWMFGKIMKHRGPDQVADFDLRVSWHFNGDFLNHRWQEGWPSEYVIEPLMAKINLELFDIFRANLETNPPLSPLELSNKMAEIVVSYRNGEIDKGVAMVEITLLDNYKSQEFYGLVIDQTGKPIVNVRANANLTFNDGSYGGFTTTNYSMMTDSNGLFEFTGLHGAGLGITVSKPGYENEWRNDVYQSPRLGKSTPADRAIYRMWSTNIHEALITGNKSFDVVPDGRPYFINLTDGTISEQEGGDLKVWIQYTNQAVRGQSYDWSAGIEVINGGLWEVPQTAINSGFIDQFTLPMWVAPTNGYSPEFGLKQQIKGGQRGEIGNRYFYLLLKNGKEYGKISINLFAPYNDRTRGMIRLSFAINPSGSRYLRPVQ